MAAACSAAMNASRSHPAVVSVLTRGEQLLELVDHQDQARRRRRRAASAGAPDSVAGPRPVAVLTASSTSIGASPGAADSDRYTDAGSAPATSASCIASSRSGLAVGRITRRGHRSDPGPSAPAARRGINPARSSEDLPAPDSPATSRIPVPSSRSASRCTSWAASSPRP